MQPTAEVISANYDLTGKVVLVSGATNGIGRETARVLALRNAKVLLGARSLEKGNEVKKQIIAGIGRDREHLLEVVLLDLSSLDSVRQFATKFHQRPEPDKQLNILINNAGIFDFAERKLTVDGFEQHFGVNHLATVLLTLLLLPYLKATAQKSGITSRIVTVASLAHTFVTQFDAKDYNSELFKPAETYGISKLGNMLGSRELNDLLTEAFDGKNNVVISNSLHPGAIVTWEPGHTDDFLKTLPLTFVSIPEGAATQVFLAGDEKANIGGFYYDQCKIAEESELAKDRKLQKDLWKLTEQLVGLTFTEAFNASA